MKLGLPLEYKKFPECFDAHNITSDTDEKNEILHKLLKEHTVETILDLTCGTGSQVLYLAKKGYKVAGSDFSPKLVEIAKQKSKKENLKCEFFDGDMRRAKLGKFDACITMFNAVGHVTKNDFKKTIKNISDNLKDGGIYIFDIFNLQALTKEVVKDFACQNQKQIEDATLLQSQVSMVDKKKGLLISYDNYTLQKNVEKPTMFSNTFSLQIYTADELKQILHANGFKVLKQSSLDGTKFIPKKSISILTVAQKI